MPRGGRRKARIGDAKGNRTDMNSPAAQAASVNRPPRIRGAPGVPTKGLQQTPGAARQPAQPAGAQGSLTRPTERPDEPLTAGAPMGPGPGPDALPPPAPSTAADELRALFIQFPSPELRELIELADMEGQTG